VTPPLDGTILAGVTRDSVIALLKNWGVKITERRVLVEELTSAHRANALREVFGTGTAAVISPVGELEWKGRRLQVGDGQPGEIARRLREALTDIHYGRAPAPADWLTLVD
jgi:branched-chain amino acid aminotransferase